MLQISTTAFIGVLLCILFMGCSSNKANLPEFLMGDFKDDYNIEYSLNEDIFNMKPDNKFHIVEWNIEDQYLIVKNDSLNSYDANLYSRIDWIKLNDMEPFVWGFCLSAYNAPTIDSAKVVEIADRSNPKTGCNGYPFSRMKPIKP